MRKYFRKITPRRFAPFTVLNSYKGETYIIDYLCKQLDKDKMKNK
jgi:hypothetical protein